MSIDELLDSPHGIIYALYGVKTHITHKGEDNEFVSVLNDDLE